ncbi:MAG: hypothetical protein V1917_03775, partial [Candidatus Gottesmanbacteria bacterium]
GQCGPGITDKTVCLSKRGTKIIPPATTGVACCNWVDANVQTPTPKPTSIPVPTGTGGQDGVYRDCPYKNAVSTTNCDSCKDPNDSTKTIDCGIFKYSCGIYCLKNDCGKAACDGPGPTNAPTSGPTATPGPTSGPTATPGPTAAPGGCDASCVSDANCISGLSCASVDGVNRCRKSSCPSESSCTCPSAPTNTPTPIVDNSTGGTDVATGQEMPVSGVGPGILGSLTVIGSILLLIVGLIL